MTADMSYNCVSILWRHVLQFHAFVNNWTFAAGQSGHREAAGPTTAELRMLALSARSQHSIDIQPLYEISTPSWWIFQPSSLSLRPVALTASLQQTLHILLNNWQWTEWPAACLQPCSWGNHSCETQDHPIIPIILAINSLLNHY